VQPNKLKKYNEVMSAIVPTIAVFGTAVALIVALVSRVIMK